jgi:ubiquinone/menaquinone biosynthesis C-methylase UbiE
MARPYQYNYSQIQPSVFNTDRRLRKAETLLRVCRDYLQTDDLTPYHALDVGSSSGIIDNFLADHFGQVTGIDIDEPAMAHARATFQRDNLSFQQDDATQMSLPDNHVDVVVCTQIYEHVPDAQSMFTEIYRVLKPGGFCYFAGNNRIMLMEPHYRLPLLSLLPRPLAHRYVRVAGRGDAYHELHFTHWTLRKMCRDFEIVDYSARITAAPERFAVDYMLPPGSLKWRAASLLTRVAPWASPMIWILRKPGPESPATAA